MPEDQRMKPVSDAFEAAYARESAADTAEAAASEDGDGGAVSGSPDAASAQQQQHPKGIWRKRHPLVPGLMDTALVRSLFVLYRKPFLAAGALRFVNTMVQFLPAIFVQRLLRY